MQKTKTAQIPPETWAEEVFRAGHQDPWKGRKRLKHDTVFKPIAVLTDGLGNVLDMPFLRDKWCFGRPEVYIRQINQKKTISYHWGPKEVFTTRCGSCKITEACGNLVAERINCSQDIKSAFEIWKTYCKSSGGLRQFSGFAGRLWQGFLRAIANHGRWESKNDHALREEASERVRKNLRKDRERKQAERERNRAFDRFLKKPPERDVVRAILAERDRRCVQLENAAGQRDKPLAVSKIPPAYRGSTAAFTADVWMVDALLQEHGKKSNPSAIAKALEKMGRHQGKGYTALRQRVNNDLSRIRACERGRNPIWEPFSIQDKLAENEIDSLMSELDRTLDQGVWGWA